MSWRRLTIATALLAALLTWGRAGRELRGQESSLPASLQVSLFSRILSFDLDLEDRVPGEVVVGIVFQERYRTSFLVKDKLLALGGTDGMVAGGKPVRFVPIELKGTTSLPEDLQSLGVNHLYLTPLRAVDVGAIARSAAAHGILTLTAVPEYTERGVAVGLGTRAGKPEILIHRGMAEEAGARFSSELLKLVRIVTPGGGR